LLYYYTDVRAFTEIHRAGALDPAALVIRHRQVHHRRPLIWLTDEHDAASPAARTVARLERRTHLGIRLTVATPNAQRWRTWVADNRVSRRETALIDEASEGQIDRLWVLPQRLSWTSWIVAEDLDTRSVIWRNSPQTAAS
jgi:hypothetical protein